MLIGPHIPEAPLVIDQRIGRRGEPFVILSILGWVLGGPFRGNVVMNFQVNCMTSTRGIESMLNRMHNQEFKELGCVDAVSKDENLSLINKATCLVLS